MMFNDDPNNLDELGSQRLMRDLRAASHQIDLMPGSEVAVVANGRRRRHRRRQATAAGVVVVLGGGTALVVQQLAQTSESSIATDDPITSVSSIPASTASVSTPPSTIADPNAIVPELVPGSAPVTSSPVVANGEAADVPLANLVDSNITWNVVEPGSAEAVAYTEIGTASPPGVVLATAPGRSDEYVPQLWRSDDGVHWSPIDVDVPFGSISRVRFGEGAIYTVGTAPGIAASQPNPLLVGTSTDSGVTWQQVELPIDANEGNDLPLVRRATAYAQTVPIDGGVLVLVNPNIELDWTAITESLSGESTDSMFDMNPDGFVLFDDPSCASHADTEPVPIGDAISMATVPARYASEEGDGECPATHYGWDEVGVDPDTVAAMFGQAVRGFVVRDGQAEEIEVPDGATSLVGSSGSAEYFTDIDGAWYTFDGSAFVAAEPPSVGNGWVVGRRDGTDYSVESDMPMMSSVQRLYVRVGDLASGTLTDWTDAAGTDVVAYSSQMAVTESGLVMVAMASPDAVLAAGGVEVTSDSVTIRRSSLRADIEVLDTNSGELIPLDRVFVDQMTGDLLVQNPDGSTRATFGADAMARVRGADRAPDGDVRWVLQSSLNGSDVAVESIAELLGVDDADISSVPRISAVGNTTVVAVTLKERNPDGTPRQLVLVGTPKT